MIARVALLLGGGLLAACLSAGQAMANPCPPGNPPTNCGPPPGAILDLEGTPVPHTYQLYTVGFTATLANTNISFSFREDPAFLGMDDVSLFNNTTSTAVPITNGGFELGPVGANAPTGWTYLNAFGAAAAGVVATGGSPGPRTGSNYYRDGAVQGYDGITQAIATTAGNSYTLSFWLNDNSSLTTFSKLSTNGNTTGVGGNGIDVLVYAGSVPVLPPTSTPEPASLALLGMALTGLGFVRRRAAS